MGIPICSKFGLAHLESTVKEAQKGASTGSVCVDSDPGSLSFEVWTYWAHDDRPYRECRFCFFDGKHVHNNCRECFQSYARKHCDAALARILFATIRLLTAPHTLSRVSSRIVEATRNRNQNCFEICLKWKLF